MRAELMPTSKRQRGLSLVELMVGIAVGLFIVAGTVTLATSQRSLVESERDEAADGARAVLELSGATVRPADPYPGWAPDMQSRILATAVRVHRDVFGREAEVVEIGRAHV